MNEIESKQDFEEEVLESGDIKVVDFWASWCGPCKQFGPVLEEVNEDLEEGVEIVKLSIEDVPELAQEYDVQSVPTLLFFQGGEPVDETVGSLTAEEVREKIEEVKS